MCAEGEELNASRPLRRALFWAPRAMGILFAAFLSVFALDVFGQGYSFLETIVALAMHLVPTGIILAVLALSWRREWIGGVLFTALGASYLVMSRGQIQAIANPLSVPLVLLGVLFLIGWRYRAEIRSAR